MEKFWRRDLYYSSLSHVMEGRTTFSDESLLRHPIIIRLDFFYSGLFDEGNLCVYVGDRDDKKTRTEGRSL